MGQQPFLRRIFNGIGLLVYWIFALGCGVPVVFAAELKFVAEPFPPFVFEVAGEQNASGPFAEVIHAVCERIMTPCSLQILPWRRALAIVESGNIDGILPVAITAERERKFFFSDPVIISSSSFFVRESSNFVYSQPKDFDGYTVGVYGPSAGSALVEQTLKNSASGKAVIEIDNVTVLRKLNAGRYGAGDSAVGIVNRDVGLYLIKTEMLHGIKYVGDLKKIPLMIAFSRKRMAKEKFQEFNSALIALIHDGTVNSILERYGMRYSR